MNAPVPKSTITRAVVAGEGHGYGDAIWPPQDANENAPLAVNTQTHESGETWLECETSPYRTTLAATICGEDPRNATLALARARSREGVLAGGKPAGVATGADGEEVLSDRVGELLTSRGEVVTDVAPSASGEPPTRVPTRKDPAATIIPAMTINPDRGKCRPPVPATDTTGVEYWSLGRVSSSALMSVAA